MRAAPLLCAAALGFAQQQPDPDRVLARAQARLADAAAAVPKYTCTQTVDRSYFRQVRQTPRSCDSIIANRNSGRSGLSLTATDRLRFDVEVADGGHEVYAWPGAARIEVEKVEDMAGGGPLGSGPFGPFLLDIFSNPAVQFQYLSESAAAGVSLFEYRYRVPLEGSHYQVQAGVIWRTTGYDGTFRLDPVSAELKQLTVRTLELPADTASCEATTIMDFDRLRIGEGDYLIPRQTRLQVIGRDASFTEDTTVYTSCHEFRGESSVHFGEAGPLPDTGFKPSVPVHAPTLKAGLRIVVVLDTEIDASRAAAGDPVWAKVGKAVVDPATKRVLVPAGATIHGRITHLEHHLEGEKYFLIGLSFDEFAMVLDAAHQLRDTRVSSDFSNSQGRSRIGKWESHTGFRGGGMLVFPDRQSKCVVPSGYTTNWITLGGS
jgi:hypothetical protein